MQFRLLYNFGRSIFRRKKRHLTNYAEYYRGACRSSSKVSVIERLEPELWLVDRFYQNSAVEEQSAFSSCYISWKTDKLGEINTHFFAIFHCELARNRIILRPFHSFWILLSQIHIYEDIWMQGTSDIASPVHSLDSFRRPSGFHSCNWLERYAVRMTVGNWRQFCSVLPSLLARITGHLQSMLPPVKLTLLVPLTSFYRTALRKETRQVSCVSSWEPNYSYFSGLSKIRVSSSVSGSVIWRSTMKHLWHCTSFPFKTVVLAVLLMITLG
jgi:hypothetical protein